MSDKQCASCGHLNPPQSNFCTNCGASEFQDVSPHPATRPVGRSELPADTALRIGMGRVVVASVLSGGLYLFYWFYLTWKQLISETTEEHYPVWHALTLLVPIYGWFRMHRHVAVINELSERRGLAASLSPGLAVVLLLVGNALDWSLVRITEPLPLILLTVVSAALTTVLIVTAQSGLNAYWERARPGNLTDARIGRGEVIFVVLGLLLWLLILLPASYE